MDAFAFLAPWIDRLAPALMPNRAEAHGDSFFLHHCYPTTLTGCTHDLVVMPFGDINEVPWAQAKNVRIMNGFPGVRCAMEIVALALRVEPRVWTMLRTQKTDTFYYLDDAETFQDCGEGIELAIVLKESLSAATISTFFTMAANPELMGEFEHAKQQLCTLDRAHRLVDYRIPLTITIRQNHGEWYPSGFANDMAKVYAIAFGLSLDGGEHIAVKTTPFRPGYVSVLLGVMDPALVKQLKKHGVRVDRLINDGFELAFTKAFDLLQDTNHPLAIQATVDGDSHIAPLFRALQRGQSIESLALTISSKCDGALFGRVLAASIRTCPTLRRLEIKCPKQIMPKHIKALVETMSMVMRGRELRVKKSEHSGTVDCPVFPCNVPSLSFVVMDGNTLTQFYTKDLEIVECDASYVGSSVVDVVRLSLSTFDECARHLVAIVVDCLPRQLKSLTLQIYACPLPRDYYDTHSYSDLEGAPLLHSDVVSSILAVAPQLEKLELDLPPSIPLDGLLLAYEDGRCRVRALSLVATCAVRLALLSALANPKTRAFQTIEELSLSGSSPVESERSDLLDAITAMLRVNDHLSYLKFTGTPNFSYSRLYIRLESASRVKLASRVALAFEDAVDRHVVALSKSALARLDAVLVATIIAFAEAPRRCRVVFHFWDQGE